MNIIEIIQKKRDSQTLSAAEIRALIEGYTARQTVSDYQAAAFCMAVWFNGMEDEELWQFTAAMRDSGAVLDLSPLGLTVDKHSTGGVADTVSLVALPLAAACGCRIAKMSGRGLGFTGGTLDKLESIPGFRTGLSQKEFFQTVERVGFSIIGQTMELAPADKKLYALRDVTATVDSIPLIASSIMSKKLACGANSLVLDVKTGNGAFMKSPEEAQKLAQTLTRIGELAGKRTVALVTDMNQPLGNKIGNGLEVAEAIEILQTGAENRLSQLSIKIAAEMVLSSHLAKTMEEAQRLTKEALVSGRGLKTLAKMIEAQGGNSLVTEDIKILPQAPYQKTITFSQSGFLTKVETEELGRCALMLGAGRLHKEDSVDAAAGLIFHKKVGDKVEKGEILAELFTSKEESFEEVSQRLQKAVTVELSPVEALPLIYTRVEGRDECGSND